MMVFGEVAISVSLPALIYNCSKSVFKGSVECASIYSPMDFQESVDTWVAVVREKAVAIIQNQENI